MKRLFMGAAAALLAADLCAAKVYEYPSLPAGALPDTEVATNIPLRVNVQRLHQFSLRLEPCDGPTDEVLVAVGHDADEDGDLSLDETAFVFGCECGQRYLVNYGTGSVSYGTDDTLAINHRYFDPSWNLAKVVKRGAGATGESVTMTVESKFFTIRIR